MVTTLRGRVLYWYMKSSIVPVGVVQKALDQIRVGLTENFKNMKSESQRITYIKEIKQLPT